MTSIEQQFLNENLTLFQLRKELGEYDVRSLLNILVSDTVLFFQVGKMMGKAQVVETVGFILEDFHHLKPEDFKLCFNNAKKGLYGQLYDRLDGQIILSWLSIYDLERTGTIEAYRERENKKIKKETTEVVGKPDDERYKELFVKNITKLLADREERKKEREKPKEPIPVNYSPVYLRSQEWMKQFDNLHRKNPIGRGQRFIKRYGEVVDINAFLEYKQWQYTEFVIKGNKHFKVSKNA